MDVDALVLGAFGYGDFRNDPTVVAEAYKTVMEAFLIFSLIEFAIYSGPRETENSEVLGEVLG